MSQAKDIFQQAIPQMLNRAVYPAYERNLRERYLQTLLTNTLGNTVYANNGELLIEATVLHQEMSELDPEFMAKALVFARNQGYMRLQPLYGLAILSKVSPQLFARIFAQVVRIPSDLTEFLTILESIGRGQGGRAVKRQVALFLNRTSEYWALKYNGRGRGFNLSDAIVTSHPIPIDVKQQALFRYLRGHETNLALIPQIEAMEKLKKVTTDKDRIKQIQKGKLPYEIVTSVITPTTKVWAHLLYQMPVSALLRHLNTLHRHDVLDHPEHLQYIQQRLTDVEALRKAKILPFQFAKAYNEVKHPELRDTLSEAVDLSFDNLPDLPGRTAIFLDISGSMNGEYLQTGAVFAYALYKKTKGNSLFWLFNTTVHDAKPSRRDSIMGQARQVKAYGGTNTGAPVKQLTDIKEKVDQIIIITDEQQNTGSAFYSELQKYRQKINPHTKAFIVDIAPYQTAMVPPKDRQTFYIYGWSDTVLSFISQTLKGFHHMQHEVEQIDLEKDL
ncbi:60 kDa SS-A/Ro ribonucleoprotein [Paenibacillus sp. SORGH_AS306]|uniref:TROVE domain-containing protein n=1 Tax=unclassified Paenibacillus TaxID=185978 RepID=UPI0027853C11|nr:MULTISPECIES: TROVE domain-containing protein [unclassified Paenibacillus]MDQ1234448.1 60 kDa SS-A/Ro ribonucleoprotein [Paenibacillus sp. SORGH_AS_0306]MDR6111494.1 60 kDa SS-A/Ro ribonucleoprotein [Paenibacillus sp. SORGH_AS_0338]